MKATFRKSILFLLIAAMAFALTACGSGETAGTSTAAKSASSQKAAATPAPEFKYVSKFANVSDVPFDYVAGGFPTAEGVYVYGGDIDGKLPPQFRFCTYDGQVKEFPAFEGLDFTTDAEGKYNYSAIKSIRSVQPMSNGNLFLLGVLSESWSSTPVEDTDGLGIMNDKNAYSIVAQILDAEGKTLSSFPIEFDESNLFLQVTALVLKDDTILTAQEGKFTAYATDGSILWQAEVNGSVGYLTANADGKVYFTADGAEGNAIYPFDMETKKAGDAIVKLPWNANAINAGSGEYDLYYSTGEYFNGVRLASGETEKIFSWVDCDVATDMDNPVYVLEDGTVCSYYSNSLDALMGVKNLLLFRISKVAATSLQDKKTLTFATLGLEFDTKQQIIDFNRVNDEYHIEIKDYSQYGNGSDLSAGALKLQTEILSGNSPDIVDLSKISSDRLAAKNLLEDLYPYLDADAELKREDFLPNVLTAAECNGKLVSTISSFTVESLAGVSAIVGDKPGWTYNDLNMALAQMPDGCAVLGPEVSRRDILNTCLMLDLENYIDWTTGKCSFDRDEFIALLNFAKSFQAMNPDIDSNIFSRIAEGEQMLTKMSLSNFTASWVNCIYFGNYPYTYIGYPTYNGEPGNYIHLNSGYGMTSACKNKDGAWQFLRTFFTEAYQRKSLTGLPSNRAAYDYLLKDAMTMKYKQDADGRFLLDDNGEKIPQPLIDSEILGTHITYYALTSEMAANLTSLAEGTARILVNDVSILNIVDEQAEAFFQGQKSAEEVAKLIQSKVDIYVNEQR